MNISFKLIHACVFAALIFIAAAPCSAHEGEREEPQPPQLQGVGVTEHLNAMLPLGLEFLDETGRSVKLSDYVNGSKPFIMTLNYYHCPMLCDPILNGLVMGLNNTPWSPGEQFELVTVSFDPMETPATAKQKKQQIVDLYQKPGAAQGWHFLTGTAKNSKALADAAGFQYRYDPNTRQYYHTAVIIVGTPEGRISRYLYGIKFEPKTLRLALTEASEGKTAPTVDKILLFCFHYDAATGKYAPVAVNIMKLGGVITVIVLVIFFATLWRHEASRKPKPAERSQP